MFKKSFVFIILLLIVNLGSLFALETLYYSPDRSLNQQMKSADLNKLIERCGLTKTEQGVVLNPMLGDGWTWLAAKDISFENKRYSFFFNDGLLYTDASIYTSHRRMKFRENVTSEIDSDVFTLAFYTDKGKESELIIFFTSDTKQQVTYTLSDKFDGKTHSYTIPLEKSGYKVISMLFTSEESFPYYFPKSIQPRQALCLNDDWKFRKGESRDTLAKKVKNSDWETISVPHSWNTEDVYDTRNVYDNVDVFTGYYRGDGWYRKEFTLSKDFKNSYLELEFEAVNQVANVWLNGQYLGQHLGGYTGFTFPINDFARFGKKQNLLVVKANNAYNFDIPPHTADYVFYGGIYRDVRINAFPKTFSNNEKVVTEFDGKTVKVSISATIHNINKELTVKANIINDKQEIVATGIKTLSASASENNITINDIKVLNPELWSPDSPSLYRFVLSLESEGVVLDENETKFGFRFLEFDENKGFFLNGKHLKLKGVNKHQDYFGYGFAVPDDLQINDLKIIKEMGANFIRLAHYPQDPSVLDACDELGILVWEEIPFVNSMGGDAFRKNTKNMFREMVLRDRNHPSVIIWGITNESAMGFTDTKQVDAIMDFYKELHDFSKIIDPTRPTVQGHNHMADESMANITDLIGRNRYYGWYNGILDDFAKTLDEEHKLFPQWKVIISEYGVGSKLGFHRDNPVKFDYSEDFQLKFHEVYWAEIAKRDFVSGSLIWNMFDFGSSVKKGNIPRINQKGMADFSRKPKDVYYFYQSQWAEKAMVYIVSHTDKIRIGNKGESKEVKVYSNADSVELFLDGKPMGILKNQYIYRWNIAFKEGENDLKAVAIKEDVRCVDKLEITYKIRD